MDIFELFLVLFFLFKTRHTWLLFKKGTLMRINQKDAIGSFVQLSQGITHYVLKGPPEGELVVFVHGISVPSETYLAVEMDKYYTNAGYQFLIFDLYGRGYSDSPDTHYTPELHVGQLAELLCALGIKKPVNLIGYSMGGGVAMHFAKSYPSLVKKLILISSVGYETSRNPLLSIIGIPVLGEFIFKIVAYNMYVRNIPKELFDFIVRIMDPDTNRNNYNECSKETLKTPEESDENIAFDVSSKHVRENAGLLRTLYSTLKYFPMAKLGSIIQDISKNNRKVLILHGENDATIPYSSSNKMKENLPNSTLITSNGNHYLVIKKKQIIHPQIVQFLQEESILK
jgi:pimeloyl-ACP methyl ester carboxylesterase